jgi:hypothetical protein
MFGGVIGFGVGGTPAVVAAVVVVATVCGFF